MTETLSPKRTSIISKETSINGFFLLFQLSLFNRSISIDYESTKNNKFLRNFKCGSNINQVGGHLTRQSTQLSFLRLSFVVINLNNSSSYSAIDAANIKKKKNCRVGSTMDSRLSKFNVFH